MATKVVVVVSGGNVQNCYAELETVEIEMIDFDNIEDDGAAALQEAEARVKEIDRTMHHVY